MEVVKSVTLNLLEPTRTKRERLAALHEAYRCALVHVVGEGGKVGRFELQGQFYNDVREFGLHSQIANDIFKDAVAILKNGGKVGRPTIPYNVPRSGSFGITANGNPVVAVATLDGRVALPIAMDGAYRRYEALRDEGYTTTFFRLNGSRVHVSLKKEFEVREGYDAVVGVDIGAHTLAAVTVLDRNGRVLRQFYLGQDVGPKQRDISLRRSKLRSRADRGSRRAKKALRRLRRYEDNFVTTRCWQVAHEIVAIAGEYNAYIAIEDLKHLNRARGNRRGNRKAKRMPYRKFRVALESVGGQKHRLVESVYPRGTSHICSRCGSVGTRTKPVFRCPGCGNVVNDDRNASVNIAIRAGLKRPGFFRDSDTAQYPGGNLPVNARTRAHDGVGLWCLQHVNHLRGTPTASAVGS